MHIESLIQPVILAGGSGTRLWPLSRSLYPKQFHTLGDSEYTLLQQSFLRAEQFTHSQPILLLAGEEHRFIVAEQVRQLRSEHEHKIILEPVGRNTAAATLIAALEAANNNPESILLLCSADHHLPDSAAFKNAVLQAANVAEQYPQTLLSLGVQPDSASSDYGYIKKGEPLADQAYKIARFTEKPDSGRAQSFLDSGEYLWNAGIFVGKAKAFLRQAERYCAKLLQDCKQCHQNISASYDFARLPAEQFAEVEAIALDYALMEKSDDAIVVLLDTVWSDLGSWNSIWDNSARDQQGNAIIGNVVSEGCDNSYLRSDNRLLAVLGVDGLVVVETRDAVLVGARAQMDSMRSLVSKLKLEHGSELETSTLVHRPWGSYESLDLGTRYQVKRITVSPGEKLSVQMHHHRAEYWVVVSGTAKVHLDNSEQLLQEGASVYIPLGSVHALENPGKLDLVLIEVQNGAYLGEDDIVRFEDRYGRVQ